MWNNIPVISSWVPLPDFHNPPRDIKIYGYVSNVGKHDRRNGKQVVTSRVRELYESPSGDLVVKTESGSLYALGIPQRAGYTTALKKAIARNK